MKGGKYYENLDHIINSKETENMTNEEFIEKYTDGNALINIEKSNFNNYKDIVILDIDFIDEINQKEESDKSNDESDNSNNFEEPKI